MLLNYVRVAIRRFYRNKLFSLINIVGLSLGLASFLFLFLVISYQLSFDRYNKKASRIYRMTTVTQIGGNSSRTAYTPALLADALKNNFPEISNVTRLSRVQSVDVQIDNETFNVHNLYWADPDLFNIFTFRILRGNASTLLSHPNSVVISETAAHRYFSNEDPVDRQIKMDNKEYVVSSVFKDLPANSHFHPEFIVNFQALIGRRTRDWSDLSTRTYILLQKHAEISQLDKELASVLRRVEPGNHFIFKPQALTAIHLHSHLNGELETNGDITNVYILSIIAFFLLFIAIANFVNLSVSQGEKRAKEIGVRKVLGTDKTQLKFQFYTETFLLVVLSCLIALTALKFSIPYLDHLFDLNIHLSINGHFIASLSGIAVIAGIGAGFYPALYLSSFTPSKVLKGNYKVVGSSVSLKNVLVIVQLMISMSLIGCALVVLSQLRFINNKDLGFSYKNLVVINLGTRQQRENFDVLKNKLLQHPEITGVTSAINYPGTRYIPGKLWVPGITGADGIPVRRGYIGSDFFKVFGMHIIKGHGFGNLTPDQLKHAAIINETALRMLGLPQPVIGDKISRQFPNDRNKQDFMEIVGVVKDFNSASLREPVKPIVLYPLTVQAHVNLIAQINTSHTSQKVILGIIRNDFKQVNPQSPFVYSFLEDTLAKNYTPDSELFEIFKLFSLLAIIIACLGLFGLIAYSTQQRSKEFAIRKVLGATFQQLALLVSTDVIKLIGMAFLISCPVIYVGMRYWLSGFVYKTPMNLSIFLMAGLSVSLLAFLTISYQVIKVGMVKPVENIRNE